MPFISKSQMRVCYSGKYPRGKGGKKWDCDKWLKETKNPECLPEKKGMKSKCLKKNTITKGKGSKATSKKHEGRTIYIGPRGGKYILVNNMKIYIKK